MGWRAAFHGCQHSKKWSISPTCPSSLTNAVANLFPYLCDFKGLEANGRGSSWPPEANSVQHPGIQRVKHARFQELLPTFTEDF